MHIVLDLDVQVVHDTAMKLDEFMSLKGMTDDHLAGLIGKDRTMVSKYRRGVVRPPLEVIAQIEAVTSNAVSFRDFLNAGEAA